MFLQFGRFFLHNSGGISLQNGQTSLPTAKLVDYRVCSQLFLFWREQNV